VPVPSTSSSTFTNTIGESSNPVLTAGRTTLTAVHLSLPNYSDRVLSAITSNSILSELDRMVEETAYHVLKYGDLTTRGDYEVFGRKLHSQYPCIEFPGPEPWVC